MRQPWWEWGMWFYRAVFTQTNGAGGAIVVDVVPVAGMSMIIVNCFAENSGTNGLVMRRVDEDNIFSGQYLSVASAAGTKGIIPQVSDRGVTDDSIMSSESTEARFFRANDKFAIVQTGAGAQNDTLTVSLRAFLSCAERPIVSKGRSTNQGDVTIGTPTVDAIR